MEETTSRSRGELEFIENKRLNINFNIELLGLFRYLNISAYIFLVMLYFIFACFLKHLFVTIEKLMLPINLYSFIPLCLQV